MPYTWNLERMGFLARPNEGNMEHGPQSKPVFPPRGSPVRVSHNPIKSSRKSAPRKVPAKSTPLKSEPSSDAFVSTTYTCKQCRQTFTTQTGLQNHIYVRHKEVGSKPFPCNSCSKAFLHASTLLRHQKEEHMGIYRHVCQVCSKGFTNKSDLKGHLVSHGGQQDYHCQLCQRSFTYKKVYKAHLANVHNIQD